MVKLNIVGKRFGKLVIEKELPCRNTSSWVSCLCDCGNRIDLQASRINIGRVSCCGCSNGDAKRKVKYLNTALYEVWKGMRARCRDINHSSYKRYGGRGVTVCKEWQESFIPFYEWCMANGWKKGLNIDKDKKGNGLLYSPETCSIITNIENARLSTQTKLNMEIANYIRTSNERTAVLAKKYNVNKTTIEKIKKGITWKP